MFGQRRLLVHRPLHGLGLLAAAASLAACTSKKAPPGGMTSPDGGAGGAPMDDGGLPGPDALADLTPEGLLRSTGQCALELYRTFRGQAAAFKTAVDAWAAAPADPAALAAAQSAWRAATATWQVAELFRFGPTAARPAPGAQGLRDEIYSWPVAGRCAVEQALVARAYTDPIIFGSFFNVRGLDAAEYLLFYPGADPGCPPANTSHVTQWNALGEAAVAQRKREYAAAVAADLDVRAAALLQAWEPAGGNFLARMAAPREAPFGSVAAAINALFDALFYLEREVKDYKLAPHTPNTTQGPCRVCSDPDESPFALAGVAHLRANLDGFARVFLGCGPEYAGPGFDDLLRGVGAGALAERMTASLREAIAVAAALPDGSFVQHARVTPADATRLYAPVQALTSAMKLELSVALSLQLPGGVAGDND